MTNITPPNVTAPAPRAGGVWLPSLTLWHREMVRFFRQRNRVVGALATPLVFWLLLGSGLNRSFTVTAPPAAVSTPAVMPDPEQQAPTKDGVGYLAYFFPGTLVLILLFTAIFSTISVIEDRREGFLQGVLVAPIARLAVVIGKVLGGASIATIQGLAFVALWPLVGGWPGTLPMLTAVLVIFVLAMGLTALSLCIAWPMDSTAGFHAVMNLFLMPMWFLSGAVFPLHTAPAPMRLVMWANPLTYGQSAVAALLSVDDTVATAAVPVGTAVGVTVVFTVTTVLLAGKLVNRPRKDGTA